MRDIGIDLGTSSVLVYMKGKGIVLEEPSVLALDKRDGQVLCYGRDASLMCGRTPPHIEVVTPLKDGVISRYELTLQMLRYFIEKACGRFLIKPRVVVCVPSGITEVEGRAVHDAATQAGARRTYLIEEPVAAALGAGIDIASEKGCLLADIGGGTSDIAVMSAGKIIVSESIKVAGDRFDEAIIRYVRRKYNILIGERTAETVKRSIGTVWQRDEVKTAVAKGRCLAEGLPKPVTLSTNEMVEALEEPITAIAEAICSVIERTPPELLKDVTEQGIVLTGGGSLLYGIDQLISNVTGIPTRVADDPLQCVVKGTGLSLDRITDIPEGSVVITRSKQQQRFLG